MAKKTTGTRLNKKEVRNRLLVVFEHSAGALLFCSGGCL